MKRLLICLALVIPFAAFGRIGETREQCESRYGKSTQTKDDGSLVFQKDELEVSVQLDASNRVNKIVYHSSHDFTKDEIQTLLKANDNEPWTVQSEKLNPTTYYRAKHLGLIGWSGGGYLEIVTEERQRHEERLIDQKIEERLRGF